MGRKLYVGNLPYETGETDLQELFARAGTVETVTVMRDMATGRARGFAFVEMGSDAEAQKAITELNAHQLGGRGLTVNEARPKTSAAAMVVVGGGMVAVDRIAGNLAGKHRARVCERLRFSSVVPHPGSASTRRSLHPTHVRNAGRHRL